MQEIKLGTTGADSRRVLEALTPLIGDAAPAEHADYIGQLYVDTVSKAVYISVATDSEDPEDDWEVADANAVLATATEAINAIKPISGVNAPSENAEYIGQMYISTGSDTVYIAKAVGSASASDDWITLSEMSEILTYAHPTSGAVAPTDPASYVGQLYVDTTASKVYIAISGSTWKELTLVTE